MSKKIRDATPVGSRRPDATPFKQQTVPACQLILTAGAVFPFFFGIGFVFTPIGVVLFLTSNSVQEISFDYTGNCKIQNKIMVGGTDYDDCEEYLKNTSADLKERCICTVDFEIDTAFEKQVFLYYGLSNFHQNHKRYVKSRDDKQLRGDNINSLDQLSDNCRLYKGRDGLPYAPCGAIANSLFNDTIKLVYHGNENSYVELTSTSIAWSTDKHGKFNNPSSWENSLSPPNWNKSADDDNGYSNEDFIVWMRTAAFPNFRKLYRIIESGLKVGKYSFEIEYNYPVTQFRGSKRVILSTASFMGGKNPFLGIAYLVVGAICNVLGVFFLWFQLGKKHHWSAEDLRNVNITH